MNREAYEKWACTVNKVPTAWEGWQAAMQHAGQEDAEPVYAFRRKGLNDFCTCDKLRYIELKSKPNLFEVAIFYTSPQPAVQHAGQGEAVGEVVTYSIGVLSPYKAGKLNRALPDGTKLYTHPQPAVPDVNQQLVEALQGLYNYDPKCPACCPSNEKAKLWDKAEEALLSAGKGGE